MINDGKKFKKKKKKRKKKRTLKNRLYMHHTQLCIERRTRVYVETAKRKVFHKGAEEASFTTIISIRDTINVYVF